MKLRNILFAFTLLLLLFNKASAQIYNMQRENCNIILLTPGATKPSYSYDLYESVLYNYLSDTTKIIVADNLRSNTFSKVQIVNFTSVYQIIDSFYIWKTTCINLHKTNISDSAWSLLGNSNTDDATNFLGTKDAQDLVFKTNNTERARIGQIGNMYFSATSNSTGTNGVSWGLSCLASGTGSTAFGDRDTASNSYAVSWGSRNNVSNLYSTVWGKANNITGQVSTGWGSQNYTSSVATNSTVWGSNDTASGLNSTAFGVGNNAKSVYETAFGSYGTLYIDNANDSLNRLLNIGNGRINGSGVSSDAFTVLKNGKVGINIDSFQANATTYNLQVNGNMSATNFRSGRYTPTFAAATNVTAVSGTVATWFRTDSMVTVSGTISITPTAASIATASITLPIASDFTSNDDLNGVMGCAAFNVAGALGAVIATDLASARFTPITTTARTFSYTFTYIVK